MPFARRGIALALMVAIVMAGVAIAIPSAVAQDPPNNQGAGKDKANAGKKKAAKKRKARGNGAVGIIQPWPFPPVLIIRHTPETHDEIQAFLNMLRYY